MLNHVVLTHCYQNGYSNCVLSFRKLSPLLPHFNFSTIGYTEQGVCFSTVGLGHVRQGGHTHLPPEDATRALHWLNVAAHYHHALVAVLEDGYTQVN